MFGCTSTTDEGAKLNIGQAAVLAGQFVGAALTGITNLTPVGAARTGGAQRVPIPTTFQLGTSLTCELGGTITLGGTISGNVDDVTGAGDLAMNATETLTDCTITIQGAQIAVRGALALTGSFIMVGGAPAAQQTARLAGNLDFLVAPSGSGTCSVNLVFDYSLETTTTSINGTACGHAIVL